MSRIRGSKIKRLRKSLGLTQRELQEKLNYKSSSMISQIEKGGRGMSVDQVIAIAKALGVHPFVLLEDDDFEDEDLKLLQEFNKLLQNKDERYSVIKTLLNLEIEK